MRRRGGDEGGGGKWVAGELDGFHGFGQEIADEEGVWEGKAEEAIGGGDEVGGAG